MLGTLAASAAAATTGVTALTGGLRLLTMSLGWVAVAIGVAVAAWQLMIEKTTAVEKADQKIRNSIQTNIDYLTRETEALRLRNEERDRETPKTGPQQSVAEKGVEALEARVAATEKDYWKARRGTGLGDGVSGWNTTTIAARWLKEKNELKELKRMQEEQNALEEVHVTGKAIENYRLEREEISKKVEAFRKLGEVTKASNGTDVPTDPLGNEASRAIALRAGELAEKLANNTITASQAQVDLNALTQEYNKTLAARPEKDKDARGAANQTLQAKLKELDLEMQLEEIRQGAAMRAAKTQFNRGDIGELQLINAELAAKVALENKAVDVAQRQYELAEAADKPAKKQEFLNRRTVAEATKADAGLEAEDRRQDALSRMNEENLAAEAKVLADKGDLVEAYLRDYEAKHGATLARLRADASVEKDPTAKATLNGFIMTLVNRGIEGKREAEGKMLQKQFDSGLKELDQTLARMESDAEGGGLGAVFRGALDAERQLAAAMPDLQQKYEALKAAAAANPGDQGAQDRATDALAKLDEAAARTRNVWVTTGKVIEKSLGDAFGKPGKALGSLITVSATYAAKQKETQANLKRDLELADSPEKAFELRQRAAEDMSSTQIKAYSDMAGAAKGFFDEESGGYKELEKVQQAFRAVEMVMAMKSMAMQLFATSTVTTAKVTATALEKTAVVSTVPVVVAAEGTKSAAYGVSALAAALAGPFPGNLVAFGTIAAMLAAIGVVVAGGSGSKQSVSEKRQETQGTGAVLGDSTAKSKSIANTLERVEDNTYQGLAVSYGMLNALRAIQSGITGLGGVLGRAGAVNTEVQGKSYGGVGGAMSNLTMGVATLSDVIFTGGLGTIIDKITGGFLGKATDKIFNAVFGGKTEGVDVGLMGSKTLLGAAKNGSATVQGYNEFKVDGGWFGKDKYKTKGTELGAEAGWQFQQVVTGLADMITMSAGVLGVSGDAFNARLDAFVIDIGKISTKDLKPDEIQAELESAFSKLGADMAKWSVAGLEPFTRAGEDYLDTLTRVSQGYQAIDVVFQSFGKVFGQVGLGSVEARERLIELSGGMDEFLSQGSYFLENFFTEQEQAASLRTRVQPTLAKYGLSADGTEASMKAFKNYILALEASGPAGAEAYAELMRVAPALKSVADVAKDVADEAKDLRDEIDELMMTQSELRAKERNELDASNRALYDQLQAAKAVAEARDRISEAYESEKASIEETVERLDGLAKSWKEFRDDLVMGDKSTLTPRQKYEAAQAKYEDTLAKARGGDTAAQDAYQEIAEAFLDASRTANASGASYTRDFEGVLRETEANEVWARAQVDVAKSSLDALKSQVEHLVSIDEKIGTVAQELANFAARQAEYLMRQAAAAGTPAPMTPDQMFPSDSRPRPGNLEELLREQMEGQKQFYAQQAQETSDIINSNAEETRRAAEAAAEAARASVTDRDWQNRNEAYAR